LGFASVWLIAICLALAYLTFKEQPLPSPLKNILSILGLLISFAGLLQLQFKEPIFYRGGDVISGGIIGASMAELMTKFLNPFGAYVLLLAVFMITLMICTQISFNQALSRLFFWTLLRFKEVREFQTKKQEKHRKKRVREEFVKIEKQKPKREVTIVKPPEPEPKKPEQEAFTFMNVAGEFQLPSLDLLNDPDDSHPLEFQKESLEANARRLERKLADFGVKGEVTEILPGPVITMYELRPAPGVKISKVAGLSDDLALALRAQSIRIIAPIPGKAAIGIEIPNNKRTLVCLKEILNTETFKNSPHHLPIALGKDITGNPVVTDLAKMPHLLVAGATGTGKSVSLNAMINSVLFKFSPAMVRFLLIDTKRIELSIYKDIPHLLHPVVTEPKEATKALRWAVAEMERRYMLLSDRGVRNIETYNRKVVKSKSAAKAADDGQGTDKTLPYIILVIDELADLMMTSSRDVEESITRLAQMARAAGIHLIIATQRPSVDVLTGIIKANFPARISFQVSSKFDSRTILDTIGSEHLLGNGDMLFLPPGVGRLTRIHGAFISEEELKRVTDFLKAQMKPSYDTTILDNMSKEEEEEDFDIEADEKYEQAVDLVIRSGQASISMLQRRLRVGYNRAARMIEAMEKAGIVGPSDGIRPREVLRRQS
jgi:S-DNA-T family DNA segregation ATPase FtsK/SpoIIIE